MGSLNPFGEFRKECRYVIQEAISKLYPGMELEVELSTPPRAEYGELSTSLCLKLEKKLGKGGREIAEQIVNNIDKSKFNLIESIEVAGPGYINFRMNYRKVAEISIKSAMTDEEYGFVKTERPLRIIVEHTSANPIHPIHIGTARNPIFGDSIARMLEKRGHHVSRHFYINDVGRQVAIIAYAYDRIGAPEAKIKPDHFIGKIYSISSCITSIMAIKKEIERIKEVPEMEEDLMKLQRNLDDLVGIASELQSSDPELFNKVLESIKKDEDPEASISKIMKLYEEGDERTVKLIRRVCESCISGFKETLGMLGISFDSWDWESNLIWENRVSSVLESLSKTPYLTCKEGAYVLLAEEAVEDLKLRSILGIKSGYIIPSFTLTRSDGTTLYITRDIAYSLYKFERADKVINVVGAEQTLAQLQLKVALCILGKSDLARNLIHFSYGLVEFPGMKISARRGRYIALDDVIREAKERAYEEVSKRSPNLSEDEKKRIAEVVGIGAIKYAMISIDPVKEFIFDWDKVINFEKNSGPFIQYAHARASGILRKESPSEEVDFSLLNHELEKRLVLLIAKFPDVFERACEELRPNLIAEFANELATSFNIFYDSLPVLKAEPELKKARLSLVKAVQVVLKNALEVLGIEAPSRM